METKQIQHVCQLLLLSLQIRRFLKRLRQRSKNSRVGVFLKKKKRRKLGHHFCHNLSLSICIVTEQLHTPCCEVETGGSHWPRARTCRCRRRGAARIGGEAGRGRGLVGGETTKCWGDAALPLSYYDTPGESRLVREDVGFCRSRVRKDAGNCADSGRRDWLRENQKRRDWKGGGGASQPRARALAAGGLGRLPGLTMESAHILVLLPKAPASKKRLVPEGAAQQRSIMKR